MHTQQMHACISYPEGKYIHTYIRTYIQLYTCMSYPKGKYIHTHIELYICISYPEGSYIHTYIHTHTYSCINAYLTSKERNTNSQSLQLKADMYIHTYIQHTYLHTYMHTYSCIHAYHTPKERSTNSHRNKGKADLYIHTYIHTIHTVIYMHIVPQRNVAPTVTATKAMLTRTIMSTPMLCLPHRYMAYWLHVIVSENI
jgi:hypothetical protein